MQEQVNTRQLVMEMLLAVTGNQERGEYSHVVIREVLAKYNYLSLQEKAFMKRLFEGTLERMIELDYCINQYSKTPVNRCKPVIRAIMRMSAYQILYLDSVPDSAACNEAVKLAKKKGFVNLSGFVNGVLRNLARNKETLTYPDPQTQYETYLSVKYSMPEWIVQMWLTQLGKERTEQVLEGLLKEHAVTVRLRGQEQQSQDLEAIAEVIEQQGGSMKQTDYLPYAYRLEKTDDVTRLPGFEQGLFVIQDVSSMLAVELLDLEQVSQECGHEIKVIDVCAAPGGKSMLAADKLQDKGSVLARDVSEYKVALMQENFDRCGLTNVTAEVWDACITDAQQIEQADVVIADVPCSGLGVIGKKRDIKYKITPEAIREITALQRRILEQAVTYVKPGGLLLFSTCTINKEENEEQAAWLQEHFPLEPVSLADRLPAGITIESAKAGHLQLLPGIHDTDGFFISIFRKTSQK